VLDGPGVLVGRRGELDALREAGCACRAARPRRPEAYGWLSHVPLPDQILDHFARPLRDPAIRRDAAKFLTAVTNRYTLDAAKRFSTFERPVLVAWATDDRFFPAAHG
jgi:hypothetical protein